MNDYLCNTNKKNRKMATTIHPYKGYLNTLFHVHVSGTETIEYRVMLKSENESKEILNGNVSPNEPFFFQIPISGQFSVECSDDSIIPLFVEDGYKYGGSRFKQAFIFDDCPWLFVVMHDRTYFYNRETHESYVEAISPDEISEISSEYVIFANKRQQERTLYSLIEQKPVLSISNIVLTNAETLVWKETEEERTFFVIWSLAQRKEVHRIHVELFTIDDKSQRLIFSSRGKVETIALSDNFNREIKRGSFHGDIVNLVVPNLAISYEAKDYGRYLLVYDIDKNDLVKKIRCNGHLSKIGDNKLIDVWARQQAIQNFDINDTDFPEAEDNTASASAYSALHDKRRLNSLLLLYPQPCRIRTDFSRPRPIVGNASLDSKPRRTDTSEKSSGLIVMPLSLIVGNGFSSGFVVLNIIKCLIYIGKRGHRGAT